MTILQELAALYEARGEDKAWPRPGFSSEKIGAVVVLSEDGSVRHIQSLIAPDAKGKMQARAMSVPAAVKRTAGINPNLLWDKTAYVLGVTETLDGPGQGKRTDLEHEAFKTKHIDLLEGAEAPALLALRGFCVQWSPSHFAAFPDAAPLVDENVVFQLSGGHRQVIWRRLRLCVLRISGGHLAGVILP